MVCSKLDIALEGVGRSRSPLCYEQTRDSTHNPRRYMRIYNVAIRDRALVYAWFFLMFTIHIAFCIWSAISPPLPFTNDWSHTGFVTCIKAFDKNTFVGVVYVIGGVFWSLESLWSLWAMKTVRHPADPLLGEYGHQSSLTTPHGLDRLARAWK